MEGIKDDPAKGRRSACGREARSGGRAKRGGGGRRPRATPRLGRARVARTGLLPAAGGQRRTPRQLPGSGATRAASCKRCAALRWAGRSEARALPRGRPSVRPPSPRRLPAALLSGLATAPPGSPAGALLRRRPPRSPGRAYTTPGGLPGSSSSGRGARLCRRALCASLGPGGRRPGVAPGPDPARGCAQLRRPAALAAPVGPDTPGHSSRAQDIGGAPLGPARAQPPASPQAPRGASSPGIRSVPARSARHVTLPPDTCPVPLPKRPGRTPSPRPVARSSTDYGHAV